MKSGTGSARPPARGSRPAGGSVGPEERSDCDRTSGGVLVRSIGLGCQSLVHELTHQEPDLGSGHDLFPPVGGRMVPAMETEADRPISLHRTPRISRRL